MEQSSALVLFSGGQDSTTCLAWALTRFARVDTVGFDYGQRHHMELKAREPILDALKNDFPEWRERLGMDSLLSLNVISQIGGNALTDGMKIEMRSNGLPNTFVPGRNLLFITAAAALAYRRSCRDLVAGVCETDYSGYPDCRDETMKALQHSLRLGMEANFNVHTPLMFIDKAETWRMAEQLGGTKLVKIIRERTVTCYNGVREERWEWGHGCGECPACELRASGYRRYLAK